MPPTSFSPGIGALGTRWNSVCSPVGPGRDPALAPIHPNDAVLALTWRLSADRPRAPDASARVIRSAQWAGYARVVPAPLQLEHAWRWAVAGRFAEHTRAANQARDLDELHVTEQHLLDVTADLAGAKGWQHCLDRLDRANANRSRNCAATSEPWALVKAATPAGRGPRCARR